MTNDDNLPIYDASEHGVDQDIRQESPLTTERNARLARYKGNRRALATQLNGGTNIDGVFKPPKSDGGPHYAAVYLRVSSEEQAKKGGTAEGYSIPYQRDACRNKAATMGLVVVEDYVDAGHSAKSAKRPALQRMLRELQVKKIKYVIVHKIDRLARNKRDDFLINEAIQAAGASLISVVDLVDDTPQGKFNYTIQAGLAQLYSDNLAVEVMKGLSKKADSGGTPYRAPVGYVNKRRFEGVADIRWVEVDPIRGPLITWAFEEYATGNWSISQLRDALTDKGFTTRGTRKRANQPISINGLHHVLGNPYYAGLVPWQGAYYEGSHDALVDINTWLRVQDVLHAHNAAGEKDRTHAHYLKGSVWCGSCGSRLVFSRNKGRGGTYDYFFCMGRRFKRTECTRKSVLVRAVEAGVEEFYERFEVKPEQVKAIREAIHAELASQREQAALGSARATRRLNEARDQRRKLLEAHYAGAVPKDLLKSEMDRLTRELATAEAELEASRTSVADLEAQLDRALVLSGSCATYYAEAAPATRRLMNQGFFTKLYIDEDGGVERADLTGPFAQIFSRAPQVTAPEDAQGVVSVTTHIGQGETASGAGGDLQNGLEVSVSAGEGQPRSGLVLTCTIRQGDLETQQGRLVPALGLNNEDVAEAEGFEPPDPVKGLLFSRQVQSAALPRLLGV